MKKMILLVFGVCVSFMCAWSRGSSSEEEAVSALSGGYGYGLNGSCIQTPGAEAGAYVYAGTSLPYEAPWGKVSIPDSLEVLFVNHVGRHGARYLSSDKFSKKLEKEFDRAGSLSYVGERVARLCEVVDSMSEGHWGELDPLGKSEQANIGKRFAVRYDALLKVNDSITGYSSYIPRCVMSMDEMTHGIVSENRDLEMSLGSGKRYSKFMRPFDTDSAFQAYKESENWQTAYQEFCDSVCPTAVALRLTGDGSRFLRGLGLELIARGVQPSGGSLEAALADTLAGEWPQEWEIEAGMSKKRAIETAQSLYSIVAGIQSLFMTEEAPADTYWGWQNYFTEQEYASLWECSNMKHYLEWTATKFSVAPAKMAEPLLHEMMSDIESASQPGYTGPAAIVRFGHAETLMPLFSLMQLPGCYYMTDDLSTVAANWQDFDVAPMAANLQMVLTRSKNTGEQYLLIYRNEVLVGNPKPWR